MFFPEPVIFMQSTKSCVKFGYWAIIVATTQYPFTQKADTSTGPAPLPARSDTGNSQDYRLASRNKPETAKLFHVPGYRNRKSEHGMPWSAHPDYCNSSTYPKV